MITRVAINDMEMSGAQYSHYILSEGTEKIAENIKKISFFPIFKIPRKKNLGVWV